MGTTRYTERKYCICGKYFTSKKNAKKAGWRRIHTAHPTCPYCVRARDRYFKARGAPRGQTFTGRRVREANML